jgi:hypothetical protein
VKGSCGKLVTKEAEKKGDYRVACRVVLLQSIQGRTAEARSVAGLEREGQHDEARNDAD